jgi:hypothetical protein
MDQREARRFVTSNPPPDYNAERRPSLLGRLFRRSSSTEETLPGIQMPGQQQRSFDSGTTERRESITEQVQQTFYNKKPLPTKVQNPDPEFNLFT